MYITLWLIYITLWLLVLTELKVKVLEIMLSSLILLLPPSHNIRMFGKLKTACKTFLYYGTEGVAFRQLIHISVRLPEVRIIHILHWQGSHKHTRTNKTH